MNNQRKLNSIERLAVEPQRKKRRYTKRKVDKRLTKRQFYFRHCGQCLNKFEEMTDQSSGNAFKPRMHGRFTRDSPAQSLWFFVWPHERLKHSLKTLKVKCDNCRKWFCSATCAPPSSYAADGTFWCTQESYSIFYRNFLNPQISIRPKRLWHSVLG